MGKAASPLLRTTLSLLSLGVALGTTACGGAAPPGNFPTRDELLKLAAQPAPQRVFRDGSVDVDTWELRGPLPEVVDGSALGAAGPWAALISEASSGKPGQVFASRAMECAARQVAAFAAEKKALPADPLLRFMAARCGVPTGALAAGFRSGEMPASTSEEEIVKQWSPNVKEDLRQLIAGEPLLAGVALARAGDRAAVAVLAAARRVDLDTVPLVPAGGKVVIKGELMNSAESIRALVTRGRFGYDTCVRDIEVNLPRFVVECEVAPDDPTARVEIAAFQPGRELGDSVVDLMVFPAGKLEQTYTRASAGSGDAPAKDAALEPLLVNRINAVRKEAGLGEVQLSQAQSRTAAQLAPYYFAAIGGELPPEVADRVALGLLAGWDVGGLVREGHFASHWLRAPAPAALVDAAMAGPFGRETLLDRTASQIAVGTVADGDTIGAVFSTYSMIDGSGKTDHTGAVLARLSKLRGKIKRPAPEPVAAIDTAIADTVARLESGIALKEALERVTEKSVSLVQNARVQAWVATASSVEKLEFPSEILSRPSLRLGVGVARYRTEGSPWTRLAVLFVVVEDVAGNNTARLPNGTSRVEF